ncbi:expressed unknown protein [Ectocarpus siliculosus]|uniref:Uncharacterized protein n=1 Tax=Ectocarpus siliculosus TaxID=2880 RepID=D7FV38_ECTSI|nr:expressed unknown protein [Ectocarpus siliculosus]|eukprot:CBJ31844.1 expressed unknown protein [Ectocarpus siliculosus]
MARRGMDTGVGSWAALVLLLVSSSVVLGLQWNKECDGGLRTWLLTTVCVTAICSGLGAIFHGRGNGTRPSRFLDDDDAWGVDDDSINVSVSSAAGGTGGRASPPEMGPEDANGNGKRSDIRITPPFKMEEGGGSGGKGVNGGGMAGGEERRDSMGDESIVSGVPSTISHRLAAQSSSLQHRYFGPGPKVFPDTIFFILVVSQWFLAGWSVVGAALYFRLFTGNRTCSPLLRHWTLLVVIIGFLSCLLAVCSWGQRVSEMESGVMAAASGLRHERGFEEEN